MPKFGPVSRNDFIKKLLKLSFTGPYPGGKHQYMLKGRLRVNLPNPHQGDISPGLLIRILKEAGISRQEWEKL